MKLLPAAMAMTLVLLTAACGGEDGSGDDRPSTAESGDASTEASDVEGSGDADEGSEDIDAAPTSTTEGTPDPGEVGEIADTLGCELGTGEQAPDGETEYSCGEFLIVDWGTAGVTEEEMWNYVDSWVDDERPTYLPADDFILVYGTEDALQPFSDALLD